MSAPSATPTKRTIVLVATATRIGSAADAEAPFRRWVLRTWRPGFVAVDISDRHPERRPDVRLEPPAARVQPSDEGAEHEASDVREERDASSVRLRAEDADV